MEMTEGMANFASSFGMGAVPMILFSSGRTAAEDGFLFDICVPHFQKAKWLEVYVQPFCKLGPHTQDYSKIQACHERTAPKRDTSFGRC